MASQIGDSTEQPAPDEVADTPLFYRSAFSLGRSLAKKEVSSSEVLDEILLRVEERNSEVNLVVTRDADRAKRQAADIDRIRTDPKSSVDLGPLAGVPITIKDSLMVEGMKTTSGALELSEFVAEYDAASVSALKNAGAIVYGKTNLPIYAGDVQSFNEVFGTSNNPWDLSRSVGGSSGGSAGALAAGFTPIEVGSDIAGSIRNPAAMCGVVGHKPSYGIVSGRGQIPGPPGTLTQADLAVIGPMARTVKDCEQALDLLIGPDEWHQTAWSLTLPSARNRLAKGLRVAVIANDPYCPVDPEIEATILSVSQKLDEMGATVDTEARPVGFDFPKADATFNQLLGAALAGGWSPIEIETMASELDAGRTVPGGLGIEGAALRHRGWLSNNERRLQMRSRWHNFFRDWDVVLAPVAPTVAIPHDHSMPMSERTIDVAGQTQPYTALMQWVGLFGLVYLPSTSVPIGLHSSGLPMALQVVGPFLEDRTCLAAATLIEQITGGFQRPPGW